ncbi:MAG: hypothetical protein C5B53_12830 [Candidatus Melainabacteria bacterium]|nr:MAG: hypothetical protein C5B53_12830 [Candidatus Melainabacteria bacterium]
MSSHRQFHIWCLFVSVNFILTGSCYAQSNASGKSIAAKAPAGSESGANTLALPRQILKTGVNLSTKSLSPNTLQLAEDLKLIPVLEKLQDLRDRVKALDASQPVTLENLSLRQELIETSYKADRIIEDANLAVDFTLAQLVAEENLYSELLASFGAERDKAVARTNAISFGTNGILWAVAEGLDIPTYRVPRYSISSGINGIIAGIVPSIASFYALRQVSGKRRTADEEGNMLAKLFDYPINPEIDYPEPVWDFLSEVPVGDRSGKSRKEQLIDRWIIDKNIPTFTSRTAKEQLDKITATVTRRKGLSIDTLTTRQLMLQQLGAEILKMKRMLYELALAVDGGKRL